MASTSETGHAKNIANLNKFNTFAVALGDTYNPSNPALEIPKLQELYTTAFTDQEKVNINLAPYSNAVDARELIFMPLNKQLTRLRKIFISTEGVGPLQIEDFMTIIRKLKGKRKPGEAKDATPEELENQHSISQMSYDQRTNTMDALIALLSNTPNYDPNEDEFKVETYQTKKRDMLESTNTVNLTFKTLNTARSVRNTTLYNGPENLVDTANKAKSYILGVLLSSSSEYKVISKLQFTKIKA